MASYNYPDTDLLGEPSLEEMLAEPIIQLVMKRDGIDESDMRGHLDRAQRAYDSLLSAQ